MRKEVEILKIGSILPSIDKKEGKDTIMVVCNGGDTFDHYVTILIEKCGDDYTYLRTDQAIVGTINTNYKFSKSDKTSNTLKGVQNYEPELGNSYGVGSWYTSTVMKIIDDNILITRNSVYAIHDVSKIREKRLNDLGI